jgi:protein-S-isoprenylcysteine O-methyltransferase
LPQGALPLLLGLFFASELTLAIVKRSRRADGATKADRGSIHALWILITLAITSAVAASGISAGRMRGSPASIRAVALAFLIGGISVRWWAVITLGKFFTVDVATHRDHTLVDTGPFRFVRHPSYTGLLSAFFGFGLALGSWISLAVMMTPILLAFAYRMRVEEAALRRALGAAYDAYCARTKRLIPGVI